MGNTNSKDLPEVEDQIPVPVVDLYDQITTGFVLPSSPRMDHNPLSLGCRSMKSAQLLTPGELCLSRRWNLVGQPDLDIPRPGVAAILPIVENHLLHGNRSLLTVVNGQPRGTLSISVAKAVVGIPIVGRRLNDPVNTLFWAESCSIYCRGRQTGLESFYRHQPGRMTWGIVIRDVAIKYSLRKHKILYGFPFGKGFKNLSHRKILLCASVMCLPPPPNGWK